MKSRRTFWNLPPLPPFPWPNLLPVEPLPVAAFGEEELSAAAEVALPWLAPLAALLAPLAALLAPLAALLAPLAAALLAPLAAALLAPLAAALPVPLPALPVPLPALPVPLPALPVPLPALPVPLPAAAAAGVAEAVAGGELSATSGPAATADAARALEFNQYSKSCQKRERLTAAARPVDPSFEAAFGVLPLPVTTNLVQSSGVPR